MRVTVVGAGFAGLLTTIHLLRNPDIHVTLVEKGPVFGAGAAYATKNPEHLLNVRVSNMSAFPEDRSHLQAWLGRQGLPCGPDEFISRATYGVYLRSLLTILTANPATSGRVRLLHADATDLRHDGGWRLVVADDTDVVSDAVVMALGNLEPMTPSVFGEVAHSPLYVNDPWRDLSRVPESATRILLVGAGLTMVDVALELQRPDRRILAISRRGLLPQAHAPHEPSEPVHFHGGPGEVLGQVREAARTRDWRAVIDQLRPEARGIWRSWSIGQRRSALRHLKPFWDVHRHRLAPVIAARVAEMRDAGQLSLHAGRLVGTALVGDGIRVAWRARRSDESLSVDVDAVVNCTGPQGDATWSDLPLLRNLFRRGLFKADPTGLGAQVDDHHRLLDARGHPRTGLYAVGSLTRGAFWEITAVPEIRVQVAEVAASIGAEAAA